MVNKTMQRRKEKGLCVQCGKGDDRTKAGKTLCEECKKKHTDYMDEKRSEWAAAGLCKICGMPTDNGKKHCKYCREKMKEKKERQLEKWRQKTSSEI